MKINIVVKYLLLPILILRKKINGKPNCNPDPAKPPTNDSRTANYGIPIANAAIKIT